MKPTILFEGLDGAGKTYALEHLKGYYEKQGESVHVVDSIPYHVFLESHDRIWFDLTNTNTRYMEYLSWQVNNFYKNILPYLGKCIILIDRYTPSCYAYNTLQEDLYSCALHKTMHTLLSEFFVPDITFLFDVPNEILAHRHSIVEQPKNLINLDFIEKVRERYRALIAMYSPEQWLIVHTDGNQPINNTVKFMLAKINSLRNTHA
jgi:thymidylate kinase